MTMHVLAAWKPAVFVSSDDTRDLVSLHDDVRQPQ